MVITGEPNFKCTDVNYNGHLQDGGDNSICQSQIGTVYFTVGKM